MNYLTPQTTIKRNSKGVEHCKNAFIQTLTTSNQGYRGLEVDAFLRLNSSFLKYGHRPSEEMLEALKAVLKTMSDMANGSASNDVFLSSLDPSVEKTQAVISFIQALRASPFDEHSDVSILMCVSRLSEIQGLVDLIGFDPLEFAVLTSDDRLNTLGRSDHGNARFLFTTHKMVESRTEGRHFDDVREFHFVGERRQVLIWDEAMLPGATLTVGRDDISSILQPVRKAHPELGDALEELFVSLREQPNGARLQIPDFASTFELTVEDVLGAITNPTEDQKRTLKSLWLLSGKWITVRNDGGTGNTMLDYSETLPEGLSPVLVLDASGRVRQTYELWEQQRGGIVRLPEASKDYYDLEIRVWNTGGGKQSFRRNREMLLEGIAKTINKRPDEKWLIVHHKTGFGINVPRDLSRLIGNNSNVSYLNWGGHDATNQFADVKNVILAGTLFYPASYYESLGRASAGFPSEMGDFRSDWSEAIARGELKHVILQAACRGSVRKCIGDRCAPCTVYIIGSKRSEIKPLLKEVFPHCCISDWKPILTTPKGKVAEALNFITEQLDQHPDSHVLFSEVQTAIAVLDSSNFRKNVREHPDFIEGLENRDIIIEKVGRRYAFMFNEMCLFDDF